MTRVAAVKYWNTMPMLQGLRSASFTEPIDVVLDSPARCAELFENRQVQVALCPVGALIGRQNYEIVSPIGIACDGTVRTVAIFSNIPLSELHTVYLYAESRTSNVLAQVLDTHYWKLGIRFVHDEVPDVLGRREGRLCIGDTCFALEQQFAYKTDLGEAWKTMTGMPFLFACWVAHETPSETFLSEFNTALFSGINSEYSFDNPMLSMSELRNYLTENIKFHMTDEVMMGLRQFLQLAGPLVNIPERAAQTLSSGY